jgi:hypothetical protein
MSTSRQIEANRVNARGSTGPRTSAGKSRTSRNARRHGLSTLVGCDPALSTEVEELVRRLVGVADADIAASARAFAEAAIDLARVERARLELIRRVLVPGIPGEWQEDRTIGDAETDTAAVVEAPEAPLDKSPMDIAGAGQAAVAVAVCQLPKLDRYERRARARRRLAARAFTDRFIDAVQRQGLGVFGFATE